MDLMEQLKSTPKWVWIAGGGVVVVGAFLVTRKTASTADTTGQNSAFTDSFGQLMSALTALQNDILNGKNSTGDGSTGTGPGGSGGGGGGSVPPPGFKLLGPPTPTQPTNTSPPKTTPGGVKSTLDSIAGSGTNYLGPPTATTPKVSPTFFGTPLPAPSSITSTATHQKVGVGVTPPIASQAFITKRTGGVMNPIEAQAVKATIPPPAPTPKTASAAYVARRTGGIDSAAEKSITASKTVAKAALPNTSYKAPTVTKHPTTTVAAPTPKTASTSFVAKRTGGF